MKKLKELKPKERPDDVVTNNYSFILVGVLDYLSIHTRLGRVDLDDKKARKLYKYLKKLAKYKQWD